MKLSNNVRSKVNTKVNELQTPKDRGVIEKGLDRWLNIEKQLNKEISHLPNKMQGLVKVQRSIQELNLEAQLVAQTVEGVSGSIKKLTQNG